ncbi:MAG TPA: MMPL family transporter, partial [Anaerovoracaceae bacterium]|nr:MMPL family transporter [Anaerovoracaceae bacterium]
MTAALKELAARIHHLSFTYFRTLLFLALGVFVLGTVFLKDLEVEATLLDARGIQKPEFSHFLANLERFGESAPLVLLQRHADVDPKVRDRFTGLLVSGLVRLEEISAVQANLFDLSTVNGSARMVQAAVSQDPERYLPQLLNAFTAEGIRRAVARVRKGLIMADNPELREWITLDVFNLHRMFGDRLHSDMANFHVARDSGYFDSEDRSMRLIFAHPRGSGEDASYCIQLTHRIWELVNQIRSSQPGFSGIRCGFAGKYGLTAQTMAAQKREITWINLISGFLIFLLMVLVFRNLKITLICYLPVFFSVFLSMVAARFFFNPLKMVSIGFAAIVLGLGVDITFHLSSRFFQYHREHDKLETAIDKTLADCIAPLTIAIATTSFGFLTLGLSRYAALRQFGMLTAFSLILTLGVTLLLFPALVRALRPEPGGDRGLNRLALLPRIVYGSTLKHPVFSRIVSGLVVIASIFIALHLRFEMSLFKLLPPDLPAAKNARLVANTYGTSFLLNTQVTL